MRKSFFITHATTSNRLRKHTAATVQIITSLKKHHTTIFFTKLAQQRQQNNHLITTTRPMKTLKLIISAVLCFSVSLASHAQDERQRSSSRKFEHALTGTWQLCTLTPGQDQQPQLSLLPILKVIGADYSFQHIGIPSEGACFIQKQGLLEKTSDSTFVEIGRASCRERV